MKAILESISSDILMALLNGTYQGLLLTCLMVAFLRLNQRLNAATRHALLLATLAVVCLLPVVHWGMASEQLRERTTGGKQTEVVAGGIGKAEEDGVANRTDRTYRTDTTYRVRKGSEAVAAAGTPAGAREATTVRTTEGRYSEESAPVAPLNAQPTSMASLRDTGLIAKRPPTVWPSASVAQAVISVWEKAVAMAHIQPLRWSPPVPLRMLGLVVVTAWIALSWFFLLRLTLQFVRLRRLKRNAESPEPEALKVFQAIQSELGIQRTPSLLVSDHITIPLAAGFFHPVVLLPSDLATSLGPGELSALLRHEVAHLARRDDWANLGQLTAQALFFFHPAVWILAKRLNVEREIACDDHVIQSACRPKEYALLLTEFVRRRSGRPFVPASGAWSHRSQLKERIDMILNSQRNTSPLPSRARVGALTLGAVILALAGLRIGPRIALGQTSVAAPAINPIGSSDSGPVVKDAPTPGALPVPSVIPDPFAAAVVPDLAPVPAAPPTAAAVPLPPSPGGAPQAVEINLRAPVPPASESLEQRLERLEKLVQELLSRDVLISGGKSGKYHGKTSIDLVQNEISTVDQTGNVHTIRVLGATPDDARRMAEVTKQMEKQARAQADQARRQVREAQQAMEERRREAELEKQEAERERKDAAEEQHRELEEQRRALVEEQAELKRRMVEIDQELVRLKASNDNKNADRK